MFLHGFTCREEYFPAPRPKIEFTIERGSRNLVPLWWVGSVTTCMRVTLLGGGNLSTRAVRRSHGSIALRLTQQLDSISYRERLLALITACRMIPLNRSKVPRMTSIRVTRASPIASSLVE